MSLNRTEIKRSWKETSIQRGISLARSLAVISISDPFQDRSMRIFIRRTSPVTKVTLFSPLSSLISILLLLPRCHRRVSNLTSLISLEKGFYCLSSASLVDQHQYHSIEGKHDILSVCLIVLGDLFRRGRRSWMMMMIWDEGFSESCLAIEMDGDLL